jgi:hypothetical protein
MVNLVSATFKFGNFFLLLLVLKGRDPQPYRSLVMYHFVSRIAADDIFPSLAFGLKSLYPTIPISHLPVPECAKRTIR